MTFFSELSEFGGRRIHATSVFYLQIARTDRDDEDDGRAFSALGVGIAVFLPITAGGDIGQAASTVI